MLFTERKFATRRHARGHNKPTTMISRQWLTRAAQRALLFPPFDFINSVAVAVAVHWPVSVTRGQCVAAKLNANVYCDVVAMFTYTPRCEIFKKKILEAYNGNDRYEFSSWKQLRCANSPIIFTSCTLYTILTTLSDEERECVLDGTKMNEWNSCDGGWPSRWWWWRSL